MHTYIHTHTHLTYFSLQHLLNPRLSRLNTPTCVWRDWQAAEQKAKTARARQSRDQERKQVCAHTHTRGSALPWSVSLPRMRCLCVSPALACSGSALRSLCPHAFRLFFYVRCIFSFFRCLPFPFPLFLSLCLPPVCVSISLSAVSLIYVSFGSAEVHASGGLNNGCVTCVFRTCPPCALCLSW